MTYQVLMLIVLPLQAITGLLLWNLVGFSKTVALVGGVRVVDTVHVLIFIFFVFYIPAHFYLGTLGRRPITISRKCSPAMRKRKSPPRRRTAQMRTDSVLGRARPTPIAEREYVMNRMLLTTLIVGAFALTGSAWAAGDPAAGKAKAAACSGCHGPTGGGTQMGTKIAGLDPAKFIQAMDDYKSGKRPNAMMKMQATALSANDIANLAAYYATLK